MYIYQRHDKDCLQATLANLLGIKYETIPAFHEAYLKRESTDDYLAELDDYLQTIGKYRILFDVTVYDDGRIGIPFYCGLKRFLCIGMLEKKGREYCHAVLLKMAWNGKNYDLSIEHDPKVNSEYDMKDLIQIELVVSL